MRPVAAALMAAAMTLSLQPAWAQDVPVETRPAIPTYWGDTGLWFVPTAETPKSKGVSFSVYRSEFDYSQGFTNVSFWPATASVGVGSRVEAFGSLRVITRIDRDTRPLFFTTPEDGGILNEYPFVREAWTGNDLGDLFAGAKFNVMSEGRNQPLALAVRGTVKIPLADEETGAGTGKTDYFTDVIASKEVGHGVELSGYTGYAFRGDPDNLDLSNSFRWGIGAGFGSRSPVRFTTELWGEEASDDSVQLLTAGMLRSADDGSSAPAFSTIRSAMNASLGLTFQGAGVAVGVGLTYHFHVDNRSDISSSYEDVTGDALSLQFRIGFHNGVRIFRPPAPQAAATPAPVAPAPPPAAPAPPPPPPPAPAPPPPAVKPPPQVVAPPAAQRTFNDIIFDFDRDVLRPDALPVLQQVLAALRADPALQFQIEGHASAEGTSEYNFALGERRAGAVRGYLIAQGIDAGRLSTISYGEERPRFENTSEANRAMNRRAAFVVRGQ